MPNRILTESICTSDGIDALSWFEEVLFYRLMVNCDDYGRFDGRAAVIKSRLFPLKDNITAKSIGAAINKLVSAELVVLYEFEDKPYLHLPSWDKHQIVRAKRSKYPAPEESCLTVQASESKCKQMQANVPVIQSESNPNPNPNPNPNTACADNVEEVAIYAAIVSCLNDAVGANYKATTPKTRGLIKARLAEGFTLEDFQTVIRKKAAAWKGTDMGKFLRPETLFGTKFEGYLNEAESKKCVIWEEDVDLEGIF